MNISIIIPTYKEPEYLDLCMQSIFDCTNVSVSKIQIIVVVDGFYALNKHILEKYKSTNDIQIDIVHFEANVGLAKATNAGVYAAEYTNILIVNDDNVFSPNWNVFSALSMPDIIEFNTIYSFNQIEPNPSMFSQFIHKDFGKDVNSFQKEKFYDYCAANMGNLITDTGSTLPILMNKYAFLAVGGWDENYPGPWVTDWDFFLKCALHNFDLLRLNYKYMYHFSKIGTSSLNKQIELSCHLYAKYKWNDSIQHNPINNKKYL